MRRNELGEAVVMNPSFNNPKLTINLMQSGINEIALASSIAADCGITVIRSPENVGFSSGHNQNLSDVGSEYILLLNADVLLSPTFLEVLVAAMSRDSELGMAGGRLYRMSRSGGKILDHGSPVLDTTGIYFTPSQRHFDRGNGEPDSGRPARRHRQTGCLPDCAAMAGRT